MTLCDKRDSTDVIKLRPLRWVLVLDHLGGPNVVIRVLKSGGGRSEKESLMEAGSERYNAAGFEDRKRPQTKEYGWF